MSPNLQRPLPLLHIHDLAPAVDESSFPEASFASKVTNFDWQFFGPFPGSSEFFPLTIAEILEQTAKGSLQAGEVSHTATALPRDMCSDLEFGSIHFEPLLGEGVKEKHSAVLRCKLVNTEERLVRVHHDRNFIEFFIGEQKITEDMVLRIPVGSWPVTLLFDNDRGATWQQLWLAPRFHDTNEAEVAQWNEGLERQLALAHAANETKSTVTQDIKIDWSTAKGREGFIRVAKSTNGYWWLVNQHNEPFYFSGVTSVNRAGTMGGRLAKPGDYAPNVDKQFNWLADKKPFVKFVTEKLQNAGFNGFGSWATEEFFDQEDMYVTDNVQTNHLHKKLGRVRFVDPFDPAWAQAVDACCADICGRNKDRKNLIGYFIDNEIGLFKGVGGIAVDLLGNPLLDRKPTPSLLQQALAEDPASPCYQATWTWVLNRYDNDLQRVFDAWERSDLSTQEDVTTLTDAQDILYKGSFDDDAAAYAVFFAEAYLKTSADAIRKHDPNHLVLGVRWAAPVSARHLVAMEARHCDVISMNNYRQNLYERVDEYGFPDVPILNGEFAWTHDASMFIHEPFEPNIGYTPNDRMWHNGMSNLLRASSHPNLIGWTWYRWVSNKRGRREDGIVGVKNNEIETNTNVHARLNARTTGHRVAHDLAPQTTPSLSNGAYVVILNDAVFVNPKLQESITFGFELKDGVAEPLVEGFNASGVVTSIRQENNSLVLDMALELKPSRFGKSVGEALYTISLDHEKLDHLTGSFTGTNKKQSVSGKASVWAMRAYRNP